MSRLTEASPGTVRYYDSKSGQFLTARYWKESDGSLKYKTLPYIKGGESKAGNR